jgi:hypothetical protein
MSSTYLREKPNQKGRIMKRTPYRNMLVSLRGPIQFTAILTLFGLLQWGCPTAGGGGGEPAPLEDPVIAVDDSTSTQINTPVSIDVLANDHEDSGEINGFTQAVDEGDNVQPNSVQDISNQLKYTPPDSYVGTVTFTYDIVGLGSIYKEDSKDTATVTVTVRDSSTLSVTKTGNGSGTVTSDPTGINCGTDCQEDYIIGTPVDLLAAPDSGSQFGGWSGDEDCSDGSVTMNTDVNCTATFNLVASGLSTLTFQVTGNGTVGSSDGGIDCEPDCIESYETGTSVFIFANLGPGLESVTWGGDCAEYGQETGFNLLMDSDKNCTATFE